TLTRRCAPPSPASQERGSDSQVWRLGPPHRGGRDWQVCRRGGCLPSAANPAPLPPAGKGCGLAGVEARLSVAWRPGRAGVGEGSAFDRLADAMTAAPSPRQPAYSVQPSSLSRWPCWRRYRGAFRSLALASTLVSHEYRREIETRVSPRTTRCWRGCVADVATPVATVVGPATIGVTLGDPVAGPPLPAWTMAAFGSLVTSFWASSARAPCTQKRLYRPAIWPVARRVVPAGSQLSAR